MKEHQIRTKSELTNEMTLLSRGAPSAKPTAADAGFYPRQSIDVRSEAGRATLTSTWPEHETLLGISTRAEGPQNGTVSKSQLHANHISNLFPKFK